MATVLIVEDDGMIALGAAQVIEDEIGAETVIVGSSIGAERHLETTRIDFALLDVHVNDGTTYDLARRLARDGIAVAFASGSDRAEVPADLAWITFLTKPCRTRELVQVVRTNLRRDHGNRKCA